jgi:N-methylhydantoinase B
LSIQQESGVEASEYQKRWRSLAEGYLPPERLEIPGGLTLHDEFETDIDTISYEVMRSRLWAINQDHMHTIRRISGSGVTVYAWDFSVSIQTEEGDGVVFGPGILFFAGCADLVVKWTLEHRAGNVGVNPGDIFAQCDPWVGTNHQMDAAVYAPIFVDGRLFCWVYNCVHQQEVGGVEPGGFVQQARDTFWEASTFPPVKLVENGVWREDLVDAWIRRSRLPQLNHLELKSQVAGVEFARARMEEMIATYGPAKVKGVMRRMISNTEAAVQTRLRTVPNGIWRDVRLCAGALPGDRKLYRLELAITKEDDRLIFDNSGTGDSVGSINTTPGVWRAALLHAALPLLAWDQFLCGAGVLACLEFHPSLGTMTSATHPAACSTSLGTTNVVTQAQYLLSKMLGSSEQLRRSMLGSSALHTQTYTQMFGIDRNGAPYANFPFDCIGGGSGACSFRDGVDHGGGLISTQLRIGNAEEWERVIPFLYLYRRELATSGGHGRWRGGTSLVTAWTGWGTSESFIASGGLMQAATLANGLSGGLPGSAGMFWSAERTRIAESLASGSWPASRKELREMAPHGGLPPAKKFDNPLREGDVFEVVPPLAAGHGDPLLREPDLVAQDVVRGRLAPPDADRIYGVILDVQGHADAGATVERRAQIREQRLAALTRRPEGLRGKAPDEAKLLCHATETVSVRDVDGTPLLCCAACREILGALEAGYRDGCGCLDTRLEAIDPELFLDPLEQLEETLVLRHYTCPGCAALLDADICRPTDPSYIDVLLTAPLV